MQLTIATAAVSTGGTSHGTVSCGFDAEGTAHLMRLLSDLYSDAHAAVLREYSANAYDSHVQAGNPGPVEVTLPTELNPTLVIADRGIGLSREEVIGVYACYGASTKRGSNDQVGAFGLGTKSAFTLGQQFIVTAVKDGWRTVAAFGLGTSGTGTVTILAHEQAREPNGVTVSISIDDPGAVQRAAGPVFATWRPGTVLVNGEPPWSVLDGALQVADGICLSACPEHVGTWGDAGLIVVMGNIGYPVSAALRDKLCRRIPASETSARILLHAQRGGQRAFAYVGIGEVDIAPSREQMRDTPRTLDRLARIVGDYRQHVAATVQHEIGSAPSLTAAARLAAALSRRPHLAGAAGRHVPLRWRGQPIAWEVRVPYPASVFDPNRQRCVHERGSFLLRRDDPELDSTLVITDVPEDRQESALRLARGFLAAREDCRRLVFAPPGAQPAGWFAFGHPDTLPVLPFTEYLAQVRRPAPAATGRAPEPVRYPAAITGPAGEQNLTTAEIAGLGLPVVVIASHEDLSSGPMRHPAFAQKVRDGVVVVEVSGGRTLAALQRRLGDGLPVTTLNDRASAVAAAVAASLTPQELNAERIHACAARTPGYLIAALTPLRSQITNAAVAAVLDLKTSTATALAQVLAGAREQQPGLFPAAKGHAGLTEQFPLLAGIRSPAPLNARSRSHVVAYLNALAGSGSRH